MPITIFKHPSPRRDATYFTVPYTMDAEQLTAYTEAEEAALIREIVTLALANVDPADFDRCGREELVNRTIRAMGSAISAKGTNND